MKNDYLIYYKSGQPERSSLVDILKGEFCCISKITKKELTPECQWSYVHMCEHISDLFLHSEKPKKRMDQLNANVIYQCLSVPLLQGLTYESDKVYRVFLDLQVLDIEHLKKLLELTETPISVAEMKKLAIVYRTSYHHLFRRLIRVILRQMSRASKVKEAYQAMQEILVSVPNFIHIYDREVAETMVSSCADSFKEKAETEEKAEKEEKPPRYLIEPQMILNNFVSLLGFRDFKELSEVSTCIFIW